MLVFDLLLIQDCIDTLRTEEGKTVIEEEINWPIFPSLLNHFSYETFILEFQTKPGYSF